MTSIDDLIAAGDIQGVMRVCHARHLEREGIPMVLGLVDERREIPRNTDAAQLASGTAIRDLLREYYSELVPFSRPDDEGALITAMQVVAFTHFEPDAAESRHARTQVPTGSASAGTCTGTGTGTGTGDGDGTGTAAGDGLTEGVRV